MNKERNSIEIKVWMMRKGISAASIAKDLGISPTLVCATINGHRGNRRVLQHLLKAKCPKKLLSLPADFGAAARR